MPLPPSVELKRKRARQHLTSLKREVGKQVTKLNREGVVRDRDRETGDYIWRVEAPDSITDRVTVLTGDFVHNLRSLLDHLGWALAREPDKRPRPEFPIYENRGPGDDGFYPAGIMKIWSLPVEAQVVIEQMQPYHSGNKSLLDIHRLDIIDKHRRLLTIPHALKGNQIYGPPMSLKEGDGNRVVFEVKDITLQVGGRLKHGDVITRMGATNPLDQIEQMQVQPVFKIGLEEPQMGGEIIRFMDRLHQFVEKVVLPKMEPLF